MEETRICKKCGVEYPISEFRMTGRWKRHSCRLCGNAKAREWKANLPESKKLSMREYDKKWKAENKDYRKEYNRNYVIINKEKLQKYKREYRNENIDKVKDSIAKWYRKNVDYVSEHNILKRHGLTSDEHDRLFIKQDGRCAICERDVCELNKPLVVDHDHNTGKVRGLLCQYCNSMLGMSGDNSEILISASNYLINGSY